MSGKMGAAVRQRALTTARGKLSAATALMAGRSTGDPALPLLADALGAVLDLLDDNEPWIAKSLAQVREAGKEATKGGKRE